MIIDKEEAVEDFKNFIELPILGTALYLKMREYKDAVSANIEAYKNMAKLRKLLKKNEDKLPKSANDLEFEIVKTNGIWIPVLPGKKDCEPSRIIPGQLVNYIVKEASEMDYGIIHWKNNLTLPGLEGRVFNTCFEKIQEDYIYGIIKNPKIEPKSTFEPELEDMIKELKNIDYEKMFEIFRLMFEKEGFREDVFKVYKLWKTLIDEENHVLKDY